jgi:tetratricopeptide (TPR) repeat protein
MNDTTQTVTQTIIASTNDHFAKGDYSAAESILEKAIEDGTDEWVIKFNLGSVKSCLGKQDQALELFQEILKQCPKNHLGLLRHNMGLCYKRKGNFKRAIQQYRKAIKHDPANPCAHNNLATCLFTLGEWKEAFYEWEWRLLAHERSRKIRNVFKTPDWSGDFSTGKNVLVYNERGRGDMIQNIRFAPFMKEMGLSVTVITRPEMVRLLSKCKGVDRVLPIGKKAKFDCVTSVNSLPLFYGADIDNIPTEPYIFPTKVRSVPASFWKKFDGKFKIGFCYAGAESHPQDCLRSVHRFMFQHFERDNVALFSLQKGLGEKREYLNKPLFDDPEPRIFFEDMEPYINDVNDTANIIDKMDLVISVDTVIAHLAGAMGKPVWNMISESPDSRWMLNQSDTPWYSTMKLFRQKSSIVHDKNAWAHPFKQASKELDKLLEKR